MSDKKTIQLNPEHICKACKNVWIMEYHQEKSQEDYFKGRMMYCKANGINLCITSPVSACSEFKDKEYGK